jgi:hypothetical protein
MRPVVGSTPPPLLTPLVPLPAAVIPPTVDMFGRLTLPLPPLPPALSNIRDIISILNGCESNTVSTNDYHITQMTKV